MVIAPRQEASLFDNRDKFDLVAVYDGSSKSFGDANTPLSILVRVISEQAFRKILKRMPMMLVGGIEAWKRDMGETELVRVTSPPLENQRPIVRKDFPNLLHSPKPNGNNHFLNGTGLDYSANVADPHEVWTPQQKSEEVTMNGSVPLEHRTLDQNSNSRYDVPIWCNSIFIYMKYRSPAEAYNTGIYSPNGVRPIIRRPAVLRPSSNSISFTRSLNDTVI
jgi:ubiquitin carboxyl-terminal hydrolase 8